MEQSWSISGVIKKKLLNQKLNRRKEIGEPINFNFFLQKLVFPIPKKV